MAKSKRQKRAQAEVRQKHRDQRERSRLISAGAVSAQPASGDLPAEPGDDGLDDDTVMLGVTPARSGWLNAVLVLAAVVATTGFAFVLLRVT